MWCISIQCTQGNQAAAHGDPSRYVLLLAAKQRLPFQRVVIGRICGRIRVPAHSPPSESDAIRDRSPSESDLPAIRVRSESRPQSVIYIYIYNYIYISYPRICAHLSRPPPPLYIYSYIYKLSPNMRPPGQTSLSAAAVDVCACASNDTNLD
jgi:hypothetical protein